MAKKKYVFEDVQKQMGEKLKKLRIESGYSSYEQFAWDNDIGRVQYWRIETGQTNLTLKILLKVLNAHNLSLETFFKGL